MIEFDVIQMDDKSSYIPVMKLGNILLHFFYKFIPYLIPAGPCCHVENSTVLSSVDVLAIKHGIDLPSQIGSLGKVCQKLHGDSSIMA